MEISVQKKPQNNFDLVIGVMSKICNTIFIYMYVYMSKQYIGCIYVCMYVC